MSKRHEAHLRPRDLKVEQSVDWCPGCGDFGILSALHQALAGLGRPRHQLAIFGGIGCSGKTQYYVNTYGVSTLHGRVLPFATGAKLANPELTVVVVGGDGDGLGIGAGHFVGAGRRNVELTYIFFNNEVYGLTKGQASPTLPLGMQTKALPSPTTQGRVNPLLMALASGYTWVGRGYAFDVKGLAHLVSQAIAHPGLAFLDVLQPCPTYNNLHTKDWFAARDQESASGSRLYHLADEGYDPVVRDDESEESLTQKTSAFMAKASEWGDRIPIGVFWENRAQGSYEERLSRQLSTYPHPAPATRPIADADGRPTADLSSILDGLRISPNPTGRE